MDTTLTLTVNGQKRTMTIPARRLLVDLLRYDLGLTGTKEGCSVGVCGLCTVLVNGKMVASCLSLAAFADGQEVTTIEGLAQDGPTGIHRLWWLPVRHLYPRTDHGGQGAPGREPRAYRRRGEGVDDGKPVPMHRLL